MALTANYQRNLMQTILIAEMKSNDRIRILLHSLIVKKRKISNTEASNLTMLIGV